MSEYGGFKLEGSTSTQVISRTATIITITIVATMNSDVKTARFVGAECDALRCHVTANALLGWRLRYTMLFDDTCHLMTKHDMT